MYRRIDDAARHCLFIKALARNTYQHMNEVIRFMDDYNEELIKGWIEDTVQEKIACEKDTLLAKGEAKGEARGYNQRQEEIITKLQNSGLTQEQKDLFMSIIGTAN